MKEVSVCGSLEKRASLVKFTMETSWLDVNGDRETH